MDTSLAVSGHGTLIARAPAATPTVFTEIAQLGDIQLPGFTRNEFDVTVQNLNIDNYVMGIPRRNATTFPMNFLALNPTHDHIQGLVKAYMDNSFDGYKFTLTSGGAIYMSYVYSGNVKAIENMKAPVDGPLTADVTLRFSGPYTVNGVVIGL
jgi:hypothetical protein